MDSPFPAGMVDEIEGFLANDSTRPPQQDLYPEVFDTSLFFPLQRQAELIWMMRQARAIKPITIMEIGADKAGGLYHWIKCLPTVENVIACEIRGTPYADAFERAFPYVAFTWMPHCSRTPDRRIEVSNDYGTIDCLFIDGDKLKFADDFHHYAPLLSPDCRVFMHDVQDSEPRQAFERVSSLPGWVGHKYIDTADSAAACARQATGVPPATPHETWLRHWRGRSCGVGMLMRAPTTQTSEGS